MENDTHMDSAREVMERFARAIIARDYPAAYACFADWLKQQMSQEGLQAAIEKQLSEIAAAAELDEMIYPEAFTISGNSCTLEDVRADRTKLYGIEPVCTVSPEMTEENFRNW